MKKMICWLTLLCLLTVSVPAALAEGGAHTVTGQDMDYRLGSDGDTLSGTVWFIDDSDVPYIALSYWPSVMDALVADPDDPEHVNGLAGMTFSMEGNTGRLTKTDGYYVEFDCDADVIRFLDYDGFIRSQSDDLLIDLASHKAADQDGSVQYLYLDASSYERYGKEAQIDAGAYGIDFIADDGECYVPLQTLSDLMLSRRYSNVLYNGEAVFIAPYGAFADPEAPLAQEFYSVQPRDRSEAMARFTYAELCMALDTLYGLKGSHHIESFDTLADETGLKPALTGTDPVEADAALYQLLALHLGDRHSGFVSPSPLSDKDRLATVEDGLGYSLASLASAEMREIYENARSAFYPDDTVPAYEEIGNTAYITFDQFISPSDDVDYYQTPPTAEAEDTYGLLLYAYQQITREDSPIENVVLDMSLNRGGESNAAAFTLAAFLGTGAISTRDTFSGAMTTANYQADMNLDGQIDENDLGLKDKTLFCLESPCSFSCGNLVPCAFKASNKVTLIGRTSGGGTCYVLPLSTADGSAFQVSGPLQMSFPKNGSF